MSCSLLPQRLRARFALHGGLPWAEAWKVACFGCLWLRCCRHSMLHRVMSRLPRPKRGLRCFTRCCGLWGQWHMEPANPCTSQTQGVWVMALVAANIACLHYSCLGLRQSLVLTSTLLTRLSKGAVDPLPASAGHAGHCLERTGGLQAGSHSGLL